MGRIELELSNGSKAWIEVTDGDEDRALQDLMNRKREFMGKWIQVGSPASSRSEFVQYDQIVKVWATIR